MDHKRETIPLFSYPYFISLVIMQVQFILNIMLDLSVYWLNFQTHMGLVLFRQHNYYNYLVLNGDLQVITGLINLLPLSWLNTFYSG